MSQTSTSPSVHSATLMPILERAALPLLLFCGALFVLLFISWFGILPRFTQFAVADALLSPTEMATYVSTLRATVQTQEQKRNRLVLPINDSFYDVLKLQKRSVINTYDLRARLIEASAGIADAADAVFIEHIALNTETHTATITGDVHHVGPRSMTVLASYVERLKSLSFVEHLEAPSYTRVQNTDGTVHSPFSLSLTLRPAQE